MVNQKGNDTGQNFKIGTFQTRITSARRKTVSFSNYLFISSWIVVRPIHILTPDINTLRTGAFKLFKCTFPGSKQFKSTFILCFFKNL